MVVDKARIFLVIGQDDYKSLARGNKQTIVVLILPEGYSEEISLLPTKLDATINISQCQIGR